MMRNLAPLVAAVLFLLAGLSATSLSERDPGYETDNKENHE